MLVRLRIFVREFGEGKIDQFVYNTTASEESSDDSAEIEFRSLEDEASDGIRTINFDAMSADEMEEYERMLALAKHKKQIAEAETTGQEESFIQLLFTRYSIKNATQVLSNSLVNQDNLPIFSHVG